MAANAVYSNRLRAFIVHVDEAHTDKKWQGFGAVEQPGLAWPDPRKDQVKWLHRLV